MALIWFGWSAYAVATVTASFLGLVTWDSVRYGQVTRSMRLGEQN